MPFLKMIKSSHTLSLILLMATNELQYSPAVSSSLSQNVSHRLQNTLLLTALIIIRRICFSIKKKKESGGEEKPPEIHFPTCALPGLLAHKGK